MTVGDEVVIERGEFTLERRLYAFRIDPSNPRRLMFWSYEEQQRQTTRHKWHTVNGWWWNTNFIPNAFRQARTAREAIDLPKSVANEALHEYIKTLTVEGL